MIRSVRVDALIDIIMVQADAGCRSPGLNNLLLYSTPIIINDSLY